MKKLRIGRPSKTAGVIAPKFLALFADVAHPRKRAYLAAYVQERGAITKARKTAGGGSSKGRWLRDDPEYRAAFEHAKRIVAETVEQEICRRAGRTAMSDGRLLSVLTYLKRKS
jgi:hypothetical protein